MAAIKAAWALDAAGTLASSAAGIVQFPSRSFWAWASLK